MELVKNSACNRTALNVFVGRDRHGNWVAREQNGIFGGLFASRAQALKYARSKIGSDRGIVVVSRRIELDILNESTITSARSDP